MIDMKKIFNILASFIFITAVGSSTLSLSIATPASAATCGTTFFGFPFWYSHLKLNADCSIKSPTNNAELKVMIWQIALNVIQIVSMATVYVCFCFILFGGFKFISSFGKPDAMAKARNTILQACIGLGIAIASVAIVNLIMTII